MCHMICIKKIIIQKNYGLSGEASWWKVCYISVCSCLLGSLLILFFYLKPYKWQICKIAFESIIWNQSYWHDCSLLVIVRGIAKAIADQRRLYLYYDEKRDIRGEYSLSTREIPRAEPKGFPEGSVHISPYIPPTWVMIRTFSISKGYSSSISFLVGQYWKSWFSVLVWQLGYIFLYCPVDETIRVHIDPVENSLVIENAKYLVG